jgi:hypothetical protein
MNYKAKNGSRMNISTTIPPHHISSRTHYKQALTSASAKNRLPQSFCAHMLKLLYNKQIIHERQG